ncbi:MAG: signal recognition particle subunit SRP19/SEC65 family protein [Candidatus Thalassarchaeaceae archaeon]|nr:signal recognition particle subunit SRP19/SEC65 family protein [Candidatus Thalassarchaeaceae archaeon]
MAPKREEMILWTGYFDSRLSRSDGRRVPKEASIPKPTLESVVWAARSAGIRKMRQEPEASHPSRPHAKEGRLVMPPRHVFEVTETSSKEGVMKAIGTALRKRSQDAKEQGKDATRGPAKGDRRGRSQRKSFKHRKSGQRKKKFGRK